jgi:hypothetical protein
MIGKTHAMFSNSKATVTKSIVNTKLGAENIPQVQPKYEVEGVSE